MSLAFVSNFQNAYVLSSNERAIFVLKGLKIHQAAQPKQQANWNDLDWFLVNAGKCTRFKAALSNT